MTVVLRRGEVWGTDAGLVLVLSSTVYNEIAAEPTVLAVPIFDREPDTGFGVTLVGGWAAVGLLSAVRKARLTRREGQVDTQVLTEVNTMLFRILATPDR